MSDLQNLIKKSFQYEKLVIKKFAQAPDTNAMIAAIEATKMSVLQKINAIWRQTPDAFPVGAKAAYSALVYSKKPLKTLADPELTQTLDSIVANLNSIYRAFINNNNGENKVFANSVIFPALEQIEKQADAFKDVMENIEEPGRIGGTGAEPVAANPSVATQPQAKALPKIDKAIQTKLNDLLVVSGKISPIDVDGNLGPETIGALKVFKREYNVAANDLAGVIAAVRSANAGGNTRTV